MLFTDNERKMAKLPLHRKKGKGRQDMIKIFINSCIVIAISFSLYELSILCYRALIKIACGHSSPDNKIQKGVIIFMLLISNIINAILICVILNITKIV